MEIFLYFVCASEVIASDDVVLGKKELSTEFNPQRAGS